MKTQSKMAIIAAAALAAASPAAAQNRSGLMGFIDSVMGSIGNAPSVDAAGSASNAAGGSRSGDRGGSSEPES